MDWDVMESPGIVTEVTEGKLRCMYARIPLGTVGF